MTPATIQGLTGPSKAANLILAGTEGLLAGRRLVVGESMEQGPGLEFPDGSKLETKPVGL